MRAKRAHYGPGIAQIGVTAETIVIRPGRPDDRRFIADLGRRTLADSVMPFRHFNRALAEASYDALLDFFYDQPHAVFVAEWDAKLAGFALMLTAMPDEITRMPQGFIAYMAVEPSAQRQGIGNRLLSAAEEEARRQGLPYMGLMVTENNAAAQALYEGSGYLTERRLLCKRL